MKRKLLCVFSIILSLMILVGCNKEENTTRESALEFKNEYEAVNNKTVRDDYKYRILNISEDNPYIKVKPNEIVKKIDNKETFYLYVGDPLCPWCRSGLEKMIQVAKKEGINDIYYIDFWDDEHNEILRDLYEVQKDGNKNKVVKTKDATEEYSKILDAVKDFAQEYTIVKDNKTYKVGEKRIFGGDHFYFENGICKKYVSLRSDKLSGAFDELTEEVLKDQETNFSNFFAKSNVCNDENNC